MRTRANRQTMPLILWVKPSVKEAYQQIADAEGLSLSRTRSAALEANTA